MKVYYLTLIYCSFCSFCLSSAGKTVIIEVLVVIVEALVLKGVRGKVKGKTTDEGLLK